MTQPKDIVGRTGEAQARRYLEERDFEFIEANWFCQSGELDLVMVDGGELVFVEVKTRIGEGAGTAEESVSAKKRTRLLRSGEWFVAEHPAFADRVWRIDLVAITMDRNGRIVRLNHYPNAVVFA